MSVDFPADDDEEEDDTVASADTDSPAMALTDDEPVALADDDEVAPVFPAEEDVVVAFEEPADSPAPAAEPAIEPAPEVMALVDEPDEDAPADAADADIDESVTPADMLSDADRTLPADTVAMAAAPEPVAPAPVAKAPAPVNEPAAEFPVTKYEIEKAPVVVAQAEEPKAPAKQPEPAKAVAVDPNVECPPTTIQVEGGRFDFDRARLRPDVIGTLDTIAERLRAEKCDAIHIVGHTDRIGTVKYNQRLSERRAAAAKQYLVKKHNIDPSRISTAGRSELEPVTQPADCKGKRKKALIKCYAPDRRVVVTASTQKPAK